MADTINYGRSGRGGKDPRKTLTSAQRRKASMDRRGKEEKESGRRVTPAGGAGLIIGFVPGIGKGASAAGKGVYKVGQKIYKTFAAAKKANPKAKPNKLVQQLQRNEADAAKMGKGIAKVKKPMSRPEKIARVAAGQGAKGRRSGTAIRNKKGQLTGVKDKDARIAKGVRDMAGPTARAAGVVAASAADGSKKKKDKPLSKLPTKTVAKRKEPVPVDDTPRPKRKPSTPKRPVQGPKDKPLKPLEGGVRYADNPFGKGKVKIDSSDEAFKFLTSDEFSGDYKGGRPGMKKNVARRKAGGKVGRGCGAALRGGGKVMK